MTSIASARILHIDETSISFAGVRIWIWVFLNPLTGETLYLLRPSRGRDVLEEVLGSGWKGTIVCDGHRSYSSYHIQRCWAHLIRKLRDLSYKNPDNADVAAALRRLQRVFADAKAGTGPNERDALRKRLERRTRSLISRYRNDPVLGSSMTTLENALPDMFRFVLDPSIAPTNNPAELLLRELVVHRKIRGCIRSVHTMQWMGYLFTCIATWKNQGLDYKQQLQKYI